MRPLAARPSSGIPCPTFALEIRGNCSAVSPPVGALGNCCTTGQDYTLIERICAFEAEINARDWQAFHRAKHPENTPGTAPPGNPRRPL
jgi:hypothetical protein